VLVALAGRNDPCPCGSGRKYKRCCIERETELRRQAEATEDLLALATLFPVLRPLDAAFEQWAGGGELFDVSNENVNAGLALIPAAERERILRAARRHCCEAWEEPAAAYGDEQEAAQIVLVGSVVAGLGECRELHHEVLAELERRAGLGIDPLDALAEALTCAELWSLPEAGAAAWSAAAGALPLTVPVVLTAQARDVWTEDHERRLRFLVARVDAKLPSPGFPNTSASLGVALDLVERDEDARLRLAGAMLEAAIPAAAAIVAAAA
jgi:hypothetical protein